MEASEVQRRLLQRYEIRVSAEMGRYVLRHLSGDAAGPQTLAVMGGNARTGVPVQQTIDLQRLVEDQ